MKRKPKNRQKHYADRVRSRLRRIETEAIMRRMLRARLLLGKPLSPRAIAMLGGVRAGELAVIASGARVGGSIIAAQKPPLIVGLEITHAIIDDMMLRVFEKKRSAS